MNSNQIATYLFAGVFLGLVVGFILTANVHDHWRTTATEQGCAQYNSKTGDFEWLKR